jgi:hypothetical protein
MSTLRDLRYESGSLWTEKATAAAGGGDVCVRERIAVVLINQFLPDSTYSIIITSVRALCYDGTTVRILSYDSVGRQS